LQIQCREEKDISFLNKQVCAVQSKKRKNDIEPESVAVVSEFGRIEAKFS